MVRCYSYPYKEGTGPRGVRLGTSWTGAFWCNHSDSLTGEGRGGKSSSRCPPGQSVSDLVSHII